MRRLAYLFIAIVLLGAALPVSAQGDTRATLVLPQPGGYGDKASLDPASPTRFFEAIVLLYDHLMIADDQGKPNPALAVSWSVDSTAKIWTLKLRQGVKFHDGKPFTSADAAYSLKHILDPNLDSPVRATLGIIQKIEAPAADTLMLTLSQPHADFAMLLMDYRVLMIPENSADTITKTGNGTGPFKLKTLNPTGTSEFVANDDYWDGKPKVAGVNVIQITDPQARIQALQAGQIDAIIDGSLTPQQAEVFKNNSNFIVKSLITGNWYNLVMRTSEKPFTDVRVRKAMRLVADRQAMLDVVLKGAGTVECDNPVWPGDPYYLKQQCPQDIAGAKALLADAGYPNGLSVDLYVSAVSPYLPPLAELYQQQAAAAGITVNIKTVPAEGYWTEIWLKKPFCASWWGQRPADQVLNEVWRSGAKWNESNWTRADYDALLDQARQTVDFDQRLALYQKAQKLISDEGEPLIPFHGNELRVIRSGISGMDVRPSLMKWNNIAKAN